MANMTSDDIPRAPRPIRLALIRQRYNPFGGAERFVSRALAGFQSEAVAATLLTRAWPASASADNPFSVQIINPPYRSRTERDRRFATAAQAWLATQSFDLVQSHERLPCDIYRAGDGVHATWLELLGRLRGPLGRLALRCNPYHRYVCRAEAAMFAHPQLQAVICNSQLVQRDIHARFGLPLARLPIIYNGVDTAEFHPALAALYREPLRAAWGIPADAFLFLFVGSGFERKGAGRAIEALAAMPDRTAFLCVVGADKRSAQYRQLAVRLKVTDRVVFVGAQQDVKPFYAAADVCVLPTLYDPFPNVAIEALACGLPLITSETCGAAEWIEPGNNGWVIGALDRAALCAAMLAATDRSRLADRRAQARISALPYTLARTVADLTALYRQLLPLDVGG